ncbi:uncharacterized protein LOC126827558 [Patella vulgata]|uniref:uncharacterized protein LOC126827558 n=1 Tax=Patella vulgata TaxID=6465 RepID=UPI0024A7D866|nr:uncharacterized protein LOC126827558 [Patella vulgata]
MKLKVTMARGRGRMREEHVHKMQKNYRFLLKNVDANLLCSGLFELCVLNDDDMEEVKNKVEGESNVQGMELLLKKLFHAGHDAYEHFIKCLKDANYHEVISTLEGTNSQSEDPNQTHAQTEESVLSVKEKVAMYEKFAELRGKQRKSHKDMIVIKEQLAENKEICDIHAEKIQSVVDRVKAFEVKLEDCQRTSQSQIEIVKSLKTQIEPIVVLIGSSDTKVRQLQTTAHVHTLEQNVNERHKIDANEQKKMNERVSALERKMEMRRNRSEQTEELSVPDGNFKVTGKTDQETQTIDDLSSETFVKNTDSIVQTQMEATRSRGCMGVDSADGGAGTDLKLNIFKTVINGKVANGSVNVGGDMKLVGLEKYITNNRKEGRTVMLISIKSFDGHEIDSYLQKHKTMSLKSLDAENEDNKI